MANHYVRAGATGTANGSDWTNAWTALPATLTRGDTYYIGDGEYEKYTFNDAVSGSTYITIKKATVADHGTGTGWSDAYGDGQAVFHATSGNGWTITTGYWVFDGQVGGGPGSWDSGHGFRVIGGGGNLAYSIRIGTSIFNGTTYQPGHIEIRHVDVGGASEEDWDDFCIYQWAELKGLGSQCITISHCYLHDSNVLLFGMFGQFWLIEDNYFFRNWHDEANHGAGFADRGTDNAVIRYNLWSDIEGTAFIDIKKNEDQDHSYWDIYGNVFFYGSGNPWAGVGVGNGTIAMTSTETGTSNYFLVYNNTFVNVPGFNTGVSFPLGTGNKVFNNIWYNCDKVSHINVEHDYNVYLNTPFAFTTEAGPHDVVDDDAASPFTDWENGDFTLKAATEAGVEVSSSNNESFVTPTLDEDMGGTTRGTDGVWDRGAFEFLTEESGESEGTLESSFCVQAGDWYMVAPKTVLGVVTSAEASTLTDTAATFPDSETDGGLVGARVTVLNNTDRTMQTRLIVGSVKATGVLTVDRAWDTTPAAGDFYILGGQPWRFRTPLIYPETGTLIRGKKLKLSMRGLGIVATQLVWVKIYAAGASYGVPEERNLLILDPFGVSRLDRLETDWINLPLVWGRRWQLEVGGLSLEQEIQVSRLEIVMEEQ